MSKQSSVELMYESFKNKFPHLYAELRSSIDETYLEAKSRHKDEISKSLDVGYQIANEDVRFKHIQSSDQYYNETFGGQDNE